MMDPDTRETDEGETRPGRRARSNPFLAFLRTLGLAVVTPVDVLTYLTTCIGKTEDGAIAQSRRWTRIWSSHCRSLIGFGVRVEGEVPAAPVLYCPNHAGYVDIFALGSVCPTFFIAQDDLESWPILGPMYKTCRHMSIARRRRSSVLRATEQIAARLRAGHSVCVFLEGTSSGNDRVLPFHASLVQAAIDAGVAVVPVGIRWRSRRGDVDVAEDVAYWKDHVFGPHVFRLTGLSEVEATITFGTPVECGTRTRKEIADDLRAEVVRLSGLPAVPADHERTA